MAKAHFASQSSESGAINGVKEVLAQTTQKGMIHTRDRPTQALKPGPEVRRAPATAKGPEEPQQRQRPVSPVSCSSAAHHLGNLETAW